MYLKGRPWNGQPTGPRGEVPEDLLSQFNLGLTGKQSQNSHVVKLQTTERPANCSCSDMPDI